MQNRVSNIERFSFFSWIHDAKEREPPAIRRRVPRKRFFLSFFSNPVFSFHIFKKTYIQTYGHISEEFLSLGNDAIPVREGSAEETTKTDLKPATKKEEEEEKSKVQNKKKRETA